MVGPKKKYCILRIQGQPVHQKLGLILEKDRKNVFTKKMVS